MYYYRITKYNPKYRDATGKYTRNEWTEFGEVGIAIQGKVLTLQEYEEVEAKFIKSIQSFLDCIGSYELKCQMVEKHLDTNEIPEQFRKLYDAIHEGMQIQKNLIPQFLQMIMRNYIWCRLFSKQIIMIHFDFNLYLYIRIAKFCENAIKKTESLGLFVEEHKNLLIDY